MGTIRGAQLALGKGGRVQVAWNGSGSAIPKSVNNSNPLLYARLDDTGTAFEPQRNLMQQTYVLDGGGTVAADANGNVYVAWHGLQTGTTSGEINRKVWLARSTNEGKTFAQEIPATDQPTACGCCGCVPTSMAPGVAHALSLRDGIRPSRHVPLVVPRSRQGVSVSTSASVEDPWLSHEPRLFAESKGRSWLPGKPMANLLDGTTRVPQSFPSRAISEVAAASIRHWPLPDGRMLVAWAEGTGWKKGGMLAWQVFDSKGNPTKEQGPHRGRIPMGLRGRRANGRGFVIIH